MADAFENLHELKQIVDELKKKQEDSEELAIVIQEIEAEQQKGLEEWIRKQERNDEELYLHIQMVQKKLVSLQQKIEADEIEQQSTLESLRSEMHLNISMKIKDEIHKEIQSREEFSNLEKTSVSNNVSLHSDSSDTVKFQTTSDQKQQDNYRDSIKKLKKNDRIFKEQFLAVRYTIDHMLTELTSLIHEQNEKIKAMEMTHQQQMESFREEVLSEVKQILKAERMTHEATLNSMRQEQEEIKTTHKQEMKALRNQLLMVKETGSVVKAKSPSTSKAEDSRTAEKSASYFKPWPPITVFRRLPKVPIRTAINGDWKLVRSKNLSQFLSINTEFPHEVTQENMRFHVVDNKLTSFAFNGNDYEMLKQLKLGTHNNQGTHWRIVENRIESWDMNGFEGRTRAMEASSRYMDKGQLVVVNEMGGCKCTRIYERIEL